MPKCLRPGIAKELYEEQGRDGHFVVVTDDDPGNEIGPIGAK